MIRKLKLMPYANAYVVDEEKTVKLYSYTTLVAVVKHTDNDETFIRCYGLFSATTRRHISAFAKEMGLTFKDFKGIAYENYYFNPTTGEVRFDHEF